MEALELFRPGDPLFVVDPYPAYAVLQSEWPIFKTEDGSWIISRYADVAALASSDQLLTTPPSDDGAQGAPLSLWHRAASSHSTARSGIARRLHQTVSSGFVQQTARDLIASLRQAGGGEVIRDLCTPLSQAVSAAILGIPLVDIRELDTLARQAV